MTTLLVILALFLLISSSYSVRLFGNRLLAGGYSETEVFNSSAIAESSKNEFNASFRDSETYTTTDAEGSAGNEVISGNLSIRERQILRIKAFWRNHIIVDTVNASVVKRTVNDLHLLQQYPTTIHMLRNDSTLMYKQFLQQLLSPLNTFKNQLKWLDLNFILHLKGLAVMATHPQLFSVANSTINRGIKLLGTSKLTSNIRNCFVKAFATCVDAKLVFLNQEVVENVRQSLLRDKELNVTSGSEVTDDSVVLSALLDLVDEDSCGYLVVLDDDVTWINENVDILRLMEAELTSTAGKSFFLLLEPKEQNISTTKASIDKSEKGTTALPNVNALPVGSTIAPPTGSPFGPSFHDIGFPGSQAIGRSFQVTLHKNGSTSMTSLPPGTMPFPPPFPNANGGIRPPDAVMNRIMEEQQRKLQQFQNQVNSSNDSAKAGFSFSSGTFSLPPNPLLSADLSDEDMQDFLKDPSNQHHMKEFMDKVTNLVKQNLPPELENVVANTPVDIKVHMMQIPVSFPVPETSPVKPPFTTKNKRVRLNKASSRTDASLTNNSLASRNGFSGSSTTLFSRLKNKILGQSPNEPSEAYDDTSIEDSGEADDESILDVTEYFVPLAFPSPQLTGNLALKSLWETLLDDETNLQVRRRNTDSLKAALSSAGLRLNSQSANYSDGNAALERELSLLGEQVGEVVFSREQAKDIVSTALQYEAAKLNLLNDEFRDNSNSNKERGVLSVWALHTAMQEILSRSPSSKGSTSLPSRMSKQELHSLITDKHERSLLGNVLFPHEVEVSYDMIGGLSEAKELLRQCVTYPLKYPRLYREGIAADAVKGVLLFGAPGTGKTMLAKAVATEGGASFLSIDASSIENKWLGESEKNARAVFTLARRIAPCVVFIDEVDSLLSSREFGDDSSHGTITSVKTTLMQEWDGLRTTKDRVVVIASTNRPFDLDEAVLRRLPRRIMVDLPDQTTREDILRVVLASNRLAADVNITRIAEYLEGYSGSDIKEVCREAVVRVSHEKALLLDRGVLSPGNMGMLESGAVDVDYLGELRPVCFADFKQALRKLKASVAENSRELQRVMDWNERYGELKTTTVRGGRQDRGGQSQLSIYL